MTTSHGNSRPPLPARRCRRLLAAATLAVLLSLGAGPLGAVSLTWDSNTSTSGAQDGAGSWNTSTANWWNGSSDVVRPNTGNDEAIFGNNNGAGGIVSLSGTLRLSKLTFNPPGSASHQISGGTLDFGGATANFGGSASGYVGSVIAGSGGLTKTGTQVLLLYGASTDTGTTTISAGKLVLGWANISGSIQPDSAIVNHGQLDFNRSNTVTQGTDFGVISGTGSVHNTATGTTILSSTNTYTGGTYVDVGMVKLGSGTGIPAGGNVTVASGAVFDTTGSYYNNSAPAAIGTVTLNEGGVMLNTANGNSDYALNQLVMTGAVVYLGTNNFYYHLYNANAAITVNTSTKTSWIFGTHTDPRIVNETGASVPVSVAAGSTPSGIDLDAGVALAGSTFTKTGAGTMRLANPNSSSPIQVSAGRLRVDAIASGTNGPFGTGTITINGGTVTYGGATGTSTIKGFTLGTTAGGGIEVSDAAAALTVTGALTGSGGVLTKTGPGVLVLTGANSYTGATTINAGTLIANDTIGAGTSATGNGGNVVVNSPGTLAGGNPAGTAGSVRGIRGLLF